MRVERRTWTRDSGWVPAFDLGAVAADVRLVLMFGNLEQVLEADCFARARAHSAIGGGVRSVRRA